MRALCLASLFKWCVSTTIFFPACEVVNRLSESHRLQLNLYFHWFYRILCSQTDQAYVTDADGLYMHNTFFYCLWCVRSWSGCRNLICYSCTCLFVDLIGLSVPREITLLWQMLMDFLFVFLICSTGEMLMIECGRTDRNRCLAAWTQGQGLKSKSPRLYLHLYFY